MALALHVLSPPAADAAGNSKANFKSHALHTEKEPWQPEETTAHEGQYVRERHAKALEAVASLDTPTRDKPASRREHKQMLKQKPPQALKQVRPLALRQACSTPTLTRVQMSREV
eukprot:328479-Pleurochrysis_carterae.AAC.4